jgi:hypothetical protein
MADVSDETLMAYADGLLDDDASARVGAAIAADAALQRRLEPFVVTGPDMASLFNETLMQPVPARLIATVLWPDSPVARPRPETWSAWLGAQIQALLSPSRLVLAAACAASLAVGVAVAPLMERDATLVAAGGAIKAGGALATALETSRSGVVVATQGIVAKPVLSFRGHDGWCREYQLGLDSGGSFSGVACRDARGAWIISAHAPVLTAAGSDTQGVRPSSAQQAPAVVDGAIDKLMAADAPATVEEEATALARSWRTP